jgi:hypothetical protein
MAGNELTNAGFAEGISFWDLGGVSGAPYIDETVYGYDGRSVFVINAEGPTSGIASQTGRTVPVTQGQILEIFAHHAGINASTTLILMIAPDQNFNAGRQDFGIQVISKGDGNPRLGLAKSFDFSHARIASPMNGYARLYLHTVNTGPNPKAMLMKPYLERVLPKTKYRCWDPGLHVNPDLQIPHWPSKLPHLRADQFSAPIIPSRVGFSGDKGVSATKKLTRNPWYNVSGQIRGDQETHAILDQFFRTAPEPFWFVRPDTLQLCQATWMAEGEPSMSGLGPDKVIQFGLQLRIY